MLRLRLWNYTETAQYDIEMYENAPVNLNFQVQDIEDINKTKGDYSQTFRVPATKRNMGYFGHLSHPDVRENSQGLIDGVYNIKRKIRAELSYNTIPLIQGHVQVKSIVRQKKHFAEYELVFFGSTVQLGASIGDKMLDQLPPPSMNYVQQDNTAVQSWFGIGTFPMDGTIRLGIMDRGQNWAGSQSGGLWTADNPIRQNEFTPYLKVSWMFDRIIEQAGFTYEMLGNWQADDLYASLYMPLYNGTPTVQGDDFNDQRMHVAVPSLQGNTSSSSWQKLQLTDSGVGCLDIGNNFNATTDEWTAPYSCYILFRSQMYVSKALVRLVKNGTEVVANLVNQQVDISGPYIPYSNYLAPTTPIWLEQGDTLTIEFLRSPAESGTAYVYGSNTVQGADASDFEIWWMSDAASGFTVDVANSMPRNIRQIDFLTSIQKCFNLVFVPDKRKPKHLHIGTMKEYLASGNQLDWTNKVDFDKDLVLRPTTDIQKLRYEWTHGTGQDFINDAVLKSTGHVYGRYEKRDSDNDFASGELKTETIFAPYVMSLIPDSSVPIHRAITANGSSIGEPKPRLAMWNGIVTDVISYHIGLEDLTTSASIFFPLFSSYGTHGLQIQPDTETTNFGWEQPFIPHSGSPIQGFYMRFWQEAVSQLYGSDARTLECSVYLTAEDIAQFSFSDQVMIENTAYRVLSIKGYDATSEGSCRVTLLKASAITPDCQYVPAAVGSNGVVIFGGGTGTSYGNKECCERYGYTWTPDKVGGNPRCRTAGYSVPPTLG